MLKPAAQVPAWDWRTSDPSNNIAIRLASMPHKGWRAPSRDGTGNNMGRNGKLNKMQYGLWHTTLIAFPNKMTHFP